jgi:hypothetical protein
VLILTVALAVSACTTTADAKHASERVQSLVRDTMNAACGEWTSTSIGPAGDPRAKPDGGRGVWFSWGQDAAGPSDRKEVMQRAWRDEGLASQTQSVRRVDGRTLHRVASARRKVNSIQFNATR